MPESSTEKHAIPPVLLQSPTTTTTTTIPNHDDHHHHNTRRRTVVVGRDTRTRIRYTQRDPYAYIGQLQSSDGNGDGNVVVWCTGTIIGPHTVLTAGHCLYYDDTWTAPQQFAPGRTNESSLHDDDMYQDPLGVWTDPDWYMVTQTFFEDQDRWEADMGLVHFPEVLLRDEKYPSIYLAAQTSFKSWWLGHSRVVGYPLDKVKENAAVVVVVVPWWNDWVLCLCYACVSSLSHTRTKTIFDICR